MEGQRGDELDSWLNISIAFIDGVGSVRVGDLQRARLAAWGSDVTALKRLGMGSCQTTRVAGLVQAAQSAVACCVSSRPEAWKRGLAMRSARACRASVWQASAIAGAFGREKVGSWEASGAGAGAGRRRRRAGQSSRRRSLVVS